MLLLHQNYEPHFPLQTTTLGSGLSTLQNFSNGLFNLVSTSASCQGDLTRPLATKPKAARSFLGAGQKIAQVALRSLYSPNFVIAPTRTPLISGEVASSTLAFHHFFVIPKTGVLVMVIWCRHRRALVASSRF